MKFWTRVHVLSLKRYTHSRKSMPKIKRISNNKKRKIKQLVEQAYTAFNKQDMDTCTNICQQIEALQSNNPDTANLRGIVAFYANDLTQAEEYFVHAVAAAPKRCDLRLTLALFYSQQHYNDLALEHYRIAYQLDPKHIDSILGYGQHLSLDDQHTQAIQILQQAKKRFPEHEIVCLSLARTYFKCGKLEETQEQLDLILNNNPENTDALLSLARLYLQQGEFQKTEQTCIKALEHKPDLVDAYALLCDVKTFQDMHDPQITAMQTLLEKTPKESLHFAILSTALSKVMHQLESYEQSFTIIKNYKDFQHANTPYDNESELAHLQSLIECFDADSFHITSEFNDATPIFIVGMPRCGSTLVEQILASHPDIQSTGEHDYFESSFKKMQAGEALTIKGMIQKPSSWWQGIAEVYLNKLRLIHPDSNKITDKSLDNIRYIGAIHKAFPKAKIIHVERNAMDTCWSIYKNDFTDGVFSYGNNLTQLGYYYRAYQRLMQHWHHILPEGVMYHLSYETLVENQQQETEKLLSFCDMPFHDDCLSFHRAKNVALTTSKAQVRKPIYKDSIQGWKHYEKQLQPLLQIVGQ